MTLQILPDESDKVAVPGNYGIAIALALGLLATAGVELPEWLTERWALGVVALAIFIVTQILRVVAWFRRETNPSPSAIQAARTTREI